MSNEDQIKGQARDQLENATAFVLVTVDIVGNAKIARWVDAHDGTAPDWHIDGVLQGYSDLLKARAVAGIAQSLSEK